MAGSPAGVIADAANPAPVLVSATKSGSHLRMVLVNVIPLWAYLN